MQFKVEATFVLFHPRITAIRQKQCKSTEKGKQDAEPKPTSSHLLEQHFSNKSPLKGQGISSKLYFAPLTTTKTERTKVMSVYCRQACLSTFRD